MKCTRANSAGFAVGARDDDDVAVWIAEPDFTMGGRGVHVRLANDSRLQGAGSFHGGVEVVDLEPDEHAVTRAGGAGVHQVRMVFLVPRVELEHELTAREQPIVKVVVIAVHERRGALRVEEARVPTTARSHIADSEQWLRTD